MNERIRDSRQSDDSFGQGERDVESEVSIGFKPLDEVDPEALARWRGSKRIVVGEPTMTGEEVSDTSPTDDLPRGVNPESLEKARTARGASTSKLKRNLEAQKERKRKAVARGEKIDKRVETKKRLKEGALLAEEEVAQEIVLRTPKHDWSENWTTRPAVSSPTPEAKPQPRQKRPQAAAASVSPAPRVERSTPLSRARATVAAKRVLPLAKNKPGAPVTTRAMSTEGAPEKSKVDTSRVDTEAKPNLGELAKKYETEMNAALDTDEMNIEAAKQRLEKTMREGEGATVGEVRTPYQEDYLARKAEVDRRAAGKARLNDFVYNARRVREGGERNTASRKEVVDQELRSLLEELGKGGLTNPERLKLQEQYKALVNERDELLGVKKPPETVPSTGDSPEAVENARLDAEVAAMNAARADDLETSSPIPEDYAIPPIAESTPTDAPKAAAPYQKPDWYSKVEASPWGPKSPDSIVMVNSVLTKQAMEGRKFKGDKKKAPKGKVATKAAPPLKKKKKSKGGWLLAAGGGVAALLAGFGIGKAVLEKGGRESLPKPAASSPNVAPRAQSPEGQPKEGLRIEDKTRTGTPLEAPPKVTLSRRESAQAMAKVAEFPIVDGSNVLMVGGGSSFDDGRAAAEKYIRNTDAKAVIYARAVDPSTGSDVIFEFKREPDGRVDYRELSSTDTLVTVPSKTAIRSKATRPVRPAPAERETETVTDVDKIDQPLTAGMAQEALRQEQERLTGATPGSR